MTETQGISAMSSRMKVKISNAQSGIKVTMTFTGDCKDMPFPECSFQIPCEGGLRVRVDSVVSSDASSTSDDGPPHQDSSMPAAGLPMGRKNFKSTRHFRLQVSAALRRSLKARNLKTVRSQAQELDVSESHLSKIYGGLRRITPELSKRIGDKLGTLPDIWITC